MNKDNYKRAMDKIQAKDELKNKTFVKIKEENNKKIPYAKYLAACAIVVVVCSTSIIYLNKNHQNQVLNNTQNQQIAKLENDLPRFESIKELKEVLKDNYKRNTRTKGLFLTDSMDMEESNSETAAEKQSDYSTTNVQVQNVDEADIVKTDGNYIYYVSNSKVYIVESNNLKISSIIEPTENSQEFYPRDIYLYKDKLVVFGNYYESKKITIREKLEEVLNDVATVDTRHMTKAIVYDITDRQSPKQVRQVSMDGYYAQSRMIEDNLYFISTKSIYYYDSIKDEELLPIVNDTARSDETRIIDPTDIVYFKNTQSYNYTIVGGFNINNNDEVYTETFFGASNNIYASENNLYITQTIYDDGYYSSNNIIYKFNLDGYKIKLQAKGEVKGNINNQFSIDEYEGNLRIATTVYNNGDTRNQLYILDEDLKQIGQIENMAKGEKIYSVRFIGRTGYIVTFKQIDPLFVIDLSNPTRPEVKGELKIPGYSSYLHPYDETHIIGIGYNTKSNGYGGITNANMKMSMFDVSDLTNPKEIFNTNIGDSYAYSEITSNHKAIFYNKNKNLIGFPVTYREYNAYNDKNGFIIFKIDLEKGFQKYGEIEQNINYKTNVKRAIYINDVLYTLSNSKIVSYDLINMNKINELEL